MKSFFDKDNYIKGSETFLLTHLNQYQFVLGSDLDFFAKDSDTFSADNPCNIYFVLARPRVTVDPNSVKIHDKVINLSFIAHNPEDKQQIDLSFEFRKAKSKLEFKSSYPHNVFQIFDGQNFIFGGRPGTIIDSSIALNNSDVEYLDYDVLYIGQSYGANGERMAIDRLKSHETVQRIFADASANNPDFDIWFMLANFEQISVVMNLPDSLRGDRVPLRSEDVSNPGIDGERALSIDEKQMLNFTEAALINYFKPAYNVMFKNNFPSKSHKSYQDCYNFDLKALFLELDTSENSRKIYTDYAKRTDYHTKMFEFNSDEDRISLLNFATRISDQKIK
ncbi:MAG: hypothetical protein ACFHU9_09100 [Fluviicola sp.]